eukprot:4468250-Prymnesium_polylepis.1
MQPPAQPRLVPRDGLLARAQLLFELRHLHRHQVLLDRLHRRRLEELRGKGDRAQRPPARRHRRLAERE